MMNNDAERAAYRNWFDSTFTNTEKETLSSIGIECGAEHKFFKYEILDMSGFIDNYKLKKIPDLYEKFIDHYIDLVPKFLHTKIDRELLKNDKYYAVWFTNRHCFFEGYKEARDKGSYLLYSPIIDINTPDMCKQLSNKLFKADDEFLSMAYDHWENPQVGCRCSLIVISERQAKRGIESGRFIFMENKLSS